MCTPRAADSSHARTDPFADTQPDTKSNASDTSTDAVAHTVADTVAHFTPNTVADAAPHVPADAEADAPPHTSVPARPLWVHFPRRSGPRSTRGQWCSERSCRALQVPEVCERAFWRWAYFTLQGLPEGKV